MSTPEELARSIAAQYDAYQALYEAWGSADGYLNWGYTTRRGQPLAEAAEALVRRVFDAVEPAAGDLLVDVGFGTGGQDFYAARTYAFDRLIGFNIAPLQVANASRLAHEYGLADRLTFHCQPAEDMALLGDAEADKMIAIECAPHFDRRRFYAEAARVLRPGGLLALADFCFAAPLGVLPRRGPPELQRVGDLRGNRQLWERHFHTRRLENISRRVRPGCRETARRALREAAEIHDPEHRRHWRQLGQTSRILSIGLLLRALRYDLILLERRTP